MTNEHGTIYVDNTTLAAVHACKCKAAMRHVLHYTTADEAHALYSGTVAHTVLADYFKGKSAEYCLQEFDLLYHPYSDEFDLGNPESKFPFKRFSWPNLHNIMEAWFENHPIDGFSFGVQPDLVEVGFEVELSDECVCGHLRERHNTSGCSYRGRCGCREYHPAFVFWGRADAVVQSYNDGALYVLDHKTTRTINPFWTEKFRMDSQMSGYVWGTQETLGMPIAGVYINAIEFGVLPSDPVRKCREHGVPYAECGNLHAKSELLIYSRTPDQLEEWHETAIGLAKDYRELVKNVKDLDSLLTHTRMEGTFTNACAFCDFKDFCQASRQTQYVDSMLVKSPWRPY